MNGSTQLALDNLLNPGFCFQFKNYRISRVAKADLEFIILLSQPLEYLDTLPSAH